ncbi:MAG: TipAS antibiotic-recognition domain-containing protein [Peptostreptococcaceae bacterium]
MTKKYNNEILENKDKYQKETKQIWANTNEYKEYKQKTKHYTKEKWNNSINMSTSILQEFSNIKNNRPESEIAQELVKRWQEHISNSYYTCSDEILLNLSVMYTEDIRFMKNIDKNGEGTAKFIRDAIEFYVNNLQK